MLNQYRIARPWYRPLEYAKRRCSDVDHKSYDGYGGRGIKCLLTYKQAEILFNRDNGWLLDQPSLDRIDPDGDYTFANCRYIELTENIKRKRPPGSIKQEQDKDEWEE